MSASVPSEFSALLSEPVTVQSERLGCAIKINKLLLPVTVSSLSVELMVTVLSLPVSVSSLSPVTLMFEPLAVIV